MISEETIRIYNKTLEPNLWDENKNLHPEIRLTLLKIAQDFYKSTDFKSEIIDILLLGSSINYNWTPESDLDVHIVMDINKEGLDPEHYRKFLDSLGGKWNQEHDITIKGHNVEIYIQDITEKNSTVEKSRKHGAMFSLLNNKWLLAPSYEKPSLDKETIKKEFHIIKDKIDVIVKERNIDGLKDLIKRIKDYRNKGLEGNEGEFSTENIVFKALRHTGMLEKLKDAVNSIYDRVVTIKENEKYLKEVTQIDVSTFDDIIEETFRIIEEESRPYILVGASDRNGYVAAIKQEYRPDDPKIFATQTHKILYNKYHDLDRSTGVDWRYRSDINELLWWDWPSEAQSEATREYLKSNYGVTNPKYINAQNRSQRDILSFHTLKYEYKDSRELGQKDIFEEIYNTIFLPESVQSDNFIVTGRVSDDLDVEGKKYTGRDNIITHAMLKRWTGHWNDFIDWRYRADENRVYYLDREPTSDQKDTIFHFLKNRFGVKDRPTFIFLRISDKPKTHFPQLPSSYQHPPFENTIIENMEKMSTEYYL